MDAKILIRLCGCADWFEPSLYAHANLYLMLDYGSNTVNKKHFVRVLFSRNFMRSFVKINPSRNGETILSFTDVVYHDIVIIFQDGKYVL